MDSHSPKTSAWIHRGFWLAFVAILIVGVVSCGRSSRSSTVSGVTGDSIFASDVPEEPEVAQEAERSDESSVSDEPNSPDSNEAVAGEDGKGEVRDATSPGGSPSTPKIPAIVRADKDEIPGADRNPDFFPGTGSDSLGRPLVRVPQTEAASALPQDRIPVESKPGTLPGAGAEPGTFLNGDSLGVAVFDSLGVATLDSLAATSPATLDSLATAPLDSLGRVTEALAQGVDPFVIPDTVEGEVSYTSAPRPAPDFGLWSFRLAGKPSEDALLFRVAERQLAHSALLNGGFFSGSQLARLDTLGFRSWAPDVWNLRAAARTAYQVGVDLENERLDLAQRYEGYPVEAPITMAMDEYLDRITAQTVQTVWADVRAKGVRTEARNQRGSVNLTLPVDLGDSVFGSVFGKGQPNLSVTGSERITFRGRSQWQPNRLEDETRGSQSKFPQLNMEQQLNLRLTGSIGDKVTVDVDQASESTTPLANRIKIQYKGYEDEILQSLDLGNTSLRLPGTRYVTFNGRAEGLFGINALAKVGDVDFNLVLTKQEGRSDSKSVTRTAERRTVTIDDYNFIDAKYFFLRSPDDCPWDLDIPSLEVYLDDNIGGNNPEDGAIEGLATVDGEVQEAAVVSGFWVPLVVNEDYVIRENLYDRHVVIELNTRLASDHSLAVAFGGQELQYSDPDLIPFGEPFQVGATLATGSEDLRLKMIRPSRSYTTVDGLDLNSGIWGPIANLELKNVYNLTGRNIIPDGFEMRIRLKGTVGGETDPDRLPDGTTFLQVTALDLQENTDQGVRAGNDKRVDASIIDFAEGILYFPDLRPFDPSSADLCEESASCSNFEWCRFNPGPNPLLEDRPAWPSDSTRYRAAEIYDQVEVGSTIDQVSKYELEMTFLSPVTSIRLNAFNILPGSEGVTANNRKLTRDRDYKIDYDLGEVEILDAANVTETDDIKVSYSFVPFGGGGQKTLAGISAFVRPDESKWNVSSTWLYSAKGGVAGLEGQRPRLGEEPSRTVVGEFAGQFQSDSWMMTDWVDALPFLDAREPSRIDFEAGLGLSIPNPNTRNQLYIDDFEGAKDVLSFNLGRRLWKFPSVPVRIREAMAYNDSLAAAQKGEIRWYSPGQALQEYDLKPTIDEQEGDDNRQMLELFFAPRGSGDNERRESWAGVTTSLSRTGVDLSRAQFIDIWVNDGIPYERRNEREGTLYLDLGAISEDAIWYQNDIVGDQADWIVVPPNDSYDTEDELGDGSLDQNDTTNEDIGLDFIADGEVGDDPFDNFAFEDRDSDEDEYEPRDFIRINGTENNQYLDSEDLNANGSLDRLSSYFEVRIDLADESLWETDVRRDFVVNDPGEPITEAPADTSGWRRIRIPLDDDELISILTDPSAAPPDWKKIFQARVWVEGFSGEFERLQIGGIEVIGNRWLEEPISDINGTALADTSLVPGEGFLVGVLNNKDDAAIYTAPFKLGTNADDNTREREQSITMVMAQFQPGHRASVYRTFPQKQNFSALYEKMQFYLKKRFVSGNADLFFSIRMSADANTDTTNYYEYRLPVPDEWKLVDVDFAPLTQLQLEATGKSNELVSKQLADGVTIFRKGEPSLNSIGRITFSVMNLGPTPLGEGAVWVDELRLNGVKKNPGVASRADLNLKFSDFLRMNANFSRDGADFLSIGDDRGSGVTNLRYGTSGNLSLDKFVERTGISLPVNFGYSKQRRTPKFQTNSDLILKTATDRDITESEDRNIRISYSGRRSDNWMKYVVDPFSVSTGYTRKINLNPTRRDTIVSRTGSVNWTLGLREEGRLELPNGMFFGLFQKPELQLLPTNISAALSGTENKNKRYSRSDLNKPFERDPNNDRRTGTLTLSGKAAPIKSLNYNITSGRNLSLQKNQVDWFGLNLGRETSRGQDLNANYNLPILSELLSPRLNWKGGSTLTLLTQGGTAQAGEPERYNSFRNSRTVGFTGRLTPKKFKTFLEGLPGFGGPDSAAVSSKVRYSSASRVSLDPVNLNYQLTTSTNHSRRIGLPSLLYQLGLDTAPGDQSRAISLAASSISRTTNYGFDTNLRLPMGLSVKARYTQSDTKSESTVLTRSSDRTWPDLDVNWGTLHKKLQVERLLRLKKFSASTRYSRKLRESGTGLSGVDSSTETTDFAPLINFKATHNSNLVATFNSTKSKSVTERFTSGRLRTVNESFRSTLTLKKTLRLRKKVKIPGSSQSRTIVTQMDVNGSIEWKTNKRGTENFVTQPVVTVNTSTFKFSAGTTYNFTDRINGNAQLGFGQDADRKNQSRTTRFTEVSVTASFSF